MNVSDFSAYAHQIGGTWNSMGEGGHALVYVTAGAIAAVVIGRIVRARRPQGPQKCRVGDTMILGGEVWKLDRSQGPK